MSVEDVQNQITTAIASFDEASPEQLASALATVNAEEVLGAIEDTQAMIGALLLDLGTVRLDTVLQQGSAADAGRAALLGALTSAENDKAVLARGSAELLSEYYQEQATALTQLDDPLQEAVRHLSAAIEAVQRFDTAQDNILLATERGSAYQEGVINAATDYRDEVL